jgi:hypothetical protein
MTETSSDVKTMNRVKMIAGFAVSIFVAIALYMILPNMTPFKMQICGISLLVLCSLTCIMWSEKNKTIAGLTAMVPFFPADLIYLNAIGTEDFTDPTKLSLLAFRTFVPIAGNGYSLYRIFVSKSLEPKEGWSTNIF